MSQIVQRPTYFSSALLSEKDALNIGYNGKGGKSQCLNKLAKTSNASRILANFLFIHFFQGVGVKVYIVGLILKLGKFQFVATR